MKPRLTVETLKAEARMFARLPHADRALYGVTDGKAIGTYFEQKFRSHLRAKYDFEAGSPTSGTDFPDLEVDVKVTSAKQPQSSCPFKDARQKIYGLGYALLVFIYEKTDNPSTSTGILKILHTIFVGKEKTADFQTTTGLLRILENNANKDDVISFIEERRLPVDEIEASSLAEEIIGKPPKVGYLTISNALQWRLQYGRVIEKAGSVEGIEKLK